MVKPQKAQFRVVPAPDGGIMIVCNPVMRRQLARALAFAPPREGQTARKVREAFLRELENPQVSAAPVSVPGPEYKGD
jgi:hypothetical protein